MVTRIFRPIAVPLLLAGTALLPAVPMSAIAQTSQADLVRPTGAADLNSNLARLASNPRDVAALIGAGEAALALEDPRAAAGFFARADAIQSGNGRIKAGLGRVMVRLQNPAEALRLFDQATRLGYPDAGFLSDRGLARDMTGDQANAQRDYQAALARSPGDAEIIRRYAASLGISGDIAGSDKMLGPLLYKSDRAAWRYRAFILAMNNRQADARKIAAQTFPAALAASLDPYMQKMPYLTAAQKAAAIHFGHFPQTVGTQIVAVTTPTPPPPAAVQPAATAGTQASAPAPTSSTSARRREREARRRDGVLASAATPQVQTPASAVTQASAPRSASSAGARRREREALRRDGVLASATPRVQSPASAPTSPQPSAAVAAAPVPAGPVPAAPTPTTVQPTPAASAPAPTPSAPAPVRMAEAAPARVQPIPQPGTERSTPSQPGTTQFAQPQSPSFQPAPAQTPGSSAQVQGPPAPGFDSLSGSVVPAQQAQSAAVSPPPPTASPGARQPALAATTPVTQPPQAATPPAAGPTPAPDPVATRSLADIIRAIDVPDSERQSSVAAVDLAEIQALQAARRAERQAAADKAKKAAAAKAKAEADAKAKAEAAEKARLAANPSRNWVQIATGADRGALAFTLKQLRAKYGEIGSQDAWIANWGRTNRLVIGPFASFSRAQAVEKSLKGAGADVFAWKSDVGEEVSQLGGK